ncbi:zinc ABC transporter substrate-binding protein [bacterium]|nr:MAG: zinc ABC transporter substrate-binding protein [bacterium]
MSWDCNGRPSSDTMSTASGTGDMKTTLLAASFALVLGSPRAAAAKPLRVVATTPELADIVRRVGGANVSVDGLARGPEDIHQVVMKPSFVTKLNKADAVVYLGLTLEHSFLTGLLDVARNPRLRQDNVRQCAGEGCIDCSEGVKVLEKPASVSRAEGEIHPQGNPHYNLDPDEGPTVARNVAAGLSRVDPAGAADYDKNLKAFLAELEPKLAEWRKRAAALKGVKAVSYHQDTPYLARFTGLQFVATVEPKPGVPPTPTHLERVVALMKAQGVKLIVREQHFDAKTTAWLAEQTGAKVAVIGVMGNALPKTGTYLEFEERNLANLLEAVRP